MEINLDKFRGSCACGRLHSLEVKRVCIQKGAINLLPAYVESSKEGEYPVVICDTNTYKAAGEKVFEFITNENKTLIVLPAESLHADEQGIKKIREIIRPKASLLLAVGAGTIHDLTRYTAKEKRIPFIAVPTAASVDGFVSTVAAMTMGGLKVTYPAVSPLAVFADTDIFIDAPYRLTASGVADLLGKYTALLDWQTAHLITGEYICEKVAAIELEAVQKVAESIEGIRQGEAAALENLMYAQILSGLAMQMVGNSRPASGAEHHLSHLWEMHVINPETEALHGEKVGVALAIVCDTYKKFLEYEIAAEPIYKGLPHGYLKEYFKGMYPSILEENMPDLLDEIDFKKLYEQFGKIKALIAALPSGEEIRGVLNAVGAKTTMKEIGLSDGIIYQSILLSPFVRRRLTLMRILNTLLNSEVF